MQISFSILPLFLLGAATTHANPIAQPADTLDKRANCNKVNAALNALKVLGPPATTFCSSYLHITPAATPVTTIPPSIVTVATSTVTVEVIQPECPNPVKRNLVFVEDEAAGIEKRINLPTLARFPAAQLSCACNCLNLTPKPAPTRTVTPPASTTNVVATTTACITCSPNGAQCTFDRPDLCCGQACLRVLPPIPGGPEATCISF